MSAISASSAAKRSSERRAEMNALHRGAIVGGEIVGVAQRDTSPLLPASRVTGIETIASGPAPVVTLPAGSLLRRAMPVS
ncbi:MAG TPA: hypothetical protein VGP48_12880 [Stellaceae bacterium]|jgi:hypothetical protein|nr:hypothetical protein [Stellaceae bacterium]